MSTDASAIEWRGVPLTDLYGAQSPWGAPEFPAVAPGRSHAVLYHIPSGGLPERPPKPQIGHDRWDQDHVRMPCSLHSLYPVHDRNGESHLKKRWEIIEHSLWQPITNSKELADAILSYNTKFKNVWKFKALHKLFEEYLEEEESQYFFDVTLPEIAKLALALPKLIQAPIPLLKQHKNSNISLSQQQIASLLANAFFCTFPRRNTTKRTSEYASYPFINFNRLYESSGSDHVLEKLKCICHYFRRVCTKVGGGAVTFSRRSVRPRALPDWAESRRPLAMLPLHVDPLNTIEEADGLIQVDFANKYLGGGVLNHGCVQEEIRFVISPELLVSMLFTEVLRPNEALLIIGAERYSKYSGYGHTFQWAGDFRDPTPWDSWHRRRCAVLAIDALPFGDRREQYRPEMITRELNKAWVGFSFATDPESNGLNYPGVATGNWGCGAFGGSPQLKCLLQMMASAQACRPMAYYTFRDMQIRDDVIGIYNLLVEYNVTVGQLYKYLISFSQSEARDIELHPYIHQLLRDEHKQTSNREEKSSQKHIEHSSSRQGKMFNECSELSNTNGKFATPEKDTRKMSAIEVKHSVNEMEVQSEAVASKSEVEIKQKKVDLDDKQMKQTEKMDISTASETSEVCLTSGMHVEESPDIFASPDAEDALTEIKVQRDGAHSQSDGAGKTHPPHPSRLVEEMEKLDAQKGAINTSVGITSPFKFNDTKVNHANETVDNLNVSQTDAVAEMKKRVSRKITDYFTKKPT